MEAYQNEQTLGSVQIDSLNRLGRRRESGQSNQRHFGGSFRRDLRQSMPRRGLVFSLETLHLRSSSAYL